MNGCQFVKLLVLSSLFSSYTVWGHDPYEILEYYKNVPSTEATEKDREIVKEAKEELKEEKAFINNSKCCKKSKIPGGGLFPITIHDCTTRAGTFCNKAGDWCSVASDDC